MFTRIQFSILTLALLATFGRPLSASADTIILRNGKKKTGEVVHMDRRSVTIQVDDFLQLKLHRAHVKEIVTNRTSKFSRDPNAVSFNYDPKAEEKAEAVPEAELVDPNDFRVPAPILVNRLDFNPKTTDGGQSDGRTIGPDGRPMSDHQIYAGDTVYFARKCRDGMIRTTPSAESDRLSALRYLANEIATIRHLGEDLKTGIMLESKERTQEKLTDTYDRFKREATKYHTKYQRPALQAPEYPLAQWLGQMDSAIRTYNMCRNQLSYEERLGMRDRINLDGGRTERGRMLRWRIKVAIIHMAQARSEMFKKFEYFFTVGRIPELPAGTKEKVWTVVHEEALLFPYKEIEGTAAYDGLREDFDAAKITRAQPLILDPDQAVEFLQRKTIKYPAASKGGKSTEIEVVEIKLTDAASKSYRSKNKLPEMDLRGWLLADRVKLVAR
jgi:hypothetical protein